MLLPRALALLALSGVSPGCGPESLTELLEPAAGENAPLVLEIVSLSSRLDHLLTGVEVRAIDPQRWEPVPLLTVPAEKMRSADDSLLAGGELPRSTRAIEVMLHLADGPRLVTLPLPDDPGPFTRAEVQVLVFREDDRGETRSLISVGLYRPAPSTVKLFPVSYPAAGEDGVVVALVSNGLDRPVRVAEIGVSRLTPRGLESVLRGGRCWHDRHSPRKIEAGQSGAVGEGYFVYRVPLPAGDLVARTHYETDHGFVDLSTRSFVQTFYELFAPLDKIIPARGGTGRSR